MKKINWKTNRGVTMTDVIIAIIILSLFVGVISSLYYKIAYYNNAIRMNAMAVHYAVRIAEDTDKMIYEDVGDNLNESIKTNYNLPDTFTANIMVKKYNEEDTTKQDIIKIVTIKIDYEFMNDKKSYEIKKLKIKE